MKNGRLKQYCSMIIMILYLILPTFAFAIVCDSRPDNRLNLCYPIVQDLEITLGMDLNRLIAWLYYFIVGVSGISSFFMLVWGGFTWLTSAGSPGKISDAKERITSAVLGLVIILSSYLILQIINPELISLRLPGLP